MIKLFSTSSFVIPTILATTIIEVILKIKIPAFLATHPSIEVINDFSVSFTLISFSDEKIFNNDGKRRKVTDKETINPKVIIQPKSIIGLIPLKINDKNAQMVVKTV